jgi:hypothetical protein
VKDILLLRHWLRLSAVLAAPGGETAIGEWLTERSASGELLDVNFTASQVILLYGTSDKLNSVKAGLKIYCMPM